MSGVRWSLLISGCWAALLLNCSGPPKTQPGIVFIASRGSRPSAVSVVWSPKDNFTLLVRAYETPEMPGEVYLLDVRTRQKHLLVDGFPAYLYGATWLPEGRHVAILAENNTKGFLPPGWWTLDIENSSAKYVLAASDAAAWSPNGKLVAVLQSSSSVTMVRLLLFDLQTGGHEIIATYPGAVAGTGLSWSPDGSHLIYSVTKQAGSDLYILDVLGRKTAALGTDARGQYPSWSPKGDIIALERYPDLCLISPDGTCATRVPNVQDAWSPTWSPDGSRLAYLGLDGIYILNVDEVLGRNVYHELCPKP